MTMPATKFPSVCCAANSMIKPRTADDATRPPAMTRTWRITRSAEKSPTTKIAALMLRRRTSERVHLRGRFGERGRRDAASVAADLPLKLLLPLERGHVLGAARDEPLDQRANVLERSVRLIGSEVAHGPQHRLRRRDGRKTPP